MADAPSFTGIVDQTASSREENKTKENTRHPYAEEAIAVHFPPAYKNFG